MSCDPLYSGIPHGRQTCWCKKLCIILLILRGRWTGYINPIRNEKRKKNKEERETFKDQSKGENPVRIITSGVMFFHCSTCRRAPLTLTSAEAPPAAVAIQVSIFSKEFEFFAASDIDCLLAIFIQGSRRIILNSKPGSWICFLQMLKLIR